MTLIDVITSFDKLRPNSFDFETKRKWVLALEEQISDFINLYRETYDDKKFLHMENPNLILTDSNIDLYVSYLISMGDLANAEYKLYNVSSAYFNSVFAQWKRKYRSYNKPDVTPAIKV